MGLHLTNTKKYHYYAFLPSKSAAEAIRGVAQLLNMLSFKRFSVLFRTCAATHNLQGCPLLLKWLVASLGRLGIANEWQALYERSQKVSACISNGFLPPCMCNCILFAASFGQIGPRWWNGAVLTVWRTVNSSPVANSILPTPCQPYGGYEVRSYSRGMASYWGAELFVVGYTFCCSSIENVLNSRAGCRSFFLQTRCHWVERSSWLQHSEGSASSIEG